MKLVFVDHQQRGLAAWNSAAPGRSGYDLTITGHPDGPLSVGHPQLTTYSASDVVGIDPAQVLRRYPQPGDLLHEPNLAASIEFDDPALPWLFSVPESRPFPWLRLVVVKASDAPRDLSLIHI